MVGKIQLKPTKLKKIKEEIKKWLLILQIIGKKAIKIISIITKVVINKYN